MMLNVNDEAQDFTAQCVRCGEFTLSVKVKDSPVLLYFYPVNYGQTCTRYITQMNDVFGEFEKLDVKVFHINPASLEDHEKWMDRMGSEYDHISDTEQKISKMYDMIITHPEHPKVFGFTNRGFVLVDDEMRIRYLWRANRPNDTVDLKLLTETLSGILG